MYETTVTESVEPFHHPFYCFETRLKPWLALNSHRFICLCLPFKARSAFAFLSLAMEFIHYTKMTLPSMVLS